ncbi:MAG: type II CRISPR RNA-guided endonuclease Cas9 [Ignavibacteriae bacterium]|nr:type II CRISPR RNA-guided endonuclease Cas9 [Ignavibacteriota bacterium]
MKKILGLDLGTNSIGWALIDEENGWLKKIEGMGSRIIPEKPGRNDVIDFEKGKNITINADRKNKRGSRRLNERYKLRRNNLIKLFSILGIIPAGLEPLFEKVIISGNKIILPDSAYSKKDKQFKPFELYEYRSKALKEEIPLSILFRIIYHLNQRRGFKSNRKANKQENNIDSDILDDAKDKPEITYEKVKIISVELTGEKKGKQKKEELKITLEDGRFAFTDKFLFKKFINENLLLEIKKEILKKSQEPKYTFSFPSNWQKSRKELNDLIIKSGGYPGKYFYEEYLKSKKEKKIYEFKVRENIVNRELYEKEFQNIWDAQFDFYMKKGININQLQKYNEAIEYIIPKNNEKEKTIWLKKGLGEFIKDYIIYYQRDLKSQIKTIGDCQFEEKYNEIIDEETGEYILKRNGPKCCPKSHPDFQEFRIWQQINNLKCFNEKDDEIILNEESKIHLFNFLNDRENAEKSEIEKVLKIYIPALFSTNIVEGKNWTGNKTKYFLNRIFKKYNYDFSVILNDFEIYLKLWHLIYSVDNLKGIKTGLKRIDCNIPEEIINVICVLDYKENDYASLSLKAIRNFLPLMRTGSLFNEDNLTEKNRKRIESFINGDLDNEFDPKTLKRLKSKKEIGDFKGLSYFEAASLIYGKHSAKQFDKYESPEQIKIVQRHSLRNPVVEQIVNETLMLVKNIWEKYPELKDGEIRIELARELKSNKEDREKISKSQDMRNVINKEAIEEIRRHKGQNYNPSLAEIEKIKLWNETGKRSPYTGKPLQISEILSEYTEIDHIIPRSRYYNDGLINKVVCESHINADKSNMTSYEYLNTGTPRQNEKLSYDDFVQLIMSFPKGKRRILNLKEIPDDFIDRQIKDTQYISKRVKEELGKIVDNKNVKTTTGQVTDYLKEQWGVAELMRRLIKPRFEELQKKYEIKEFVKVEDVIGRNNEPTGKKRTVIKGYSKRFDHRHHALDALIVACTRQGIIQQLNLLNQITKGKTKKIEETIGGSLRKFIPPLGKDDIKAERFYSMVEEAMNSIIISIKNKKRLVSKGVNWYQKYNPETNRIEKFKQDESNGKDRAWSIKGKLHKETNYGVYKYNGQLRHISNCKLVELTENMISNIPNEKLKSEIIEHINKIEYIGDIKKAFGAEGLLEFNKDRKIPAYTVRVMEDGIIGKVVGKTPLYDIERKLEVEKGSNFCVTVYENPETKERKFDVVSFFDAVKLKTSGENPYQTDKGLEYNKNGFKFIFTLSHNDLVYVPKPDENLENINFEEKINLFKRIFRVVKFSGITIYFQPHNYSKEITVHEGKAKSAKEYMGEFGKGTNGTEFFKESGLPIKNICIKLKVDRLGNIKPDINL